MLLCATTNDLTPELSFGILFNIVYNKILELLLNYVWKAQDVIKKSYKKCCMR